MDHRAGIVVHIHHVLCPGDLYSLGQVLIALLLHDLQDLFAAAHQSDLRPKSLDRFNGPQHGSLGGQIAAHCVQDDLHWITFLLFRS